MTYISIFAALLVASSSLSVHAGSISAREAKDLAGTYSVFVIGMSCGDVGSSCLHGDRWKVPVLSGLDARRQDSIRVHRVTGPISYRYGVETYPTLPPKQLTALQRKTAASRIGLLGDAVNRRRVLFRSSE
jgi:hypothetical protein